MEAPAELLAALPALATALALLLAWLLLRRGAAASSNPAGAPPEPAPPAEAGGTPEPPGPCAAEPAAAPEGPGEPALPDKPTAAPAEAAAAAAEEEEQAAEERQEEEQELRGEEEPPQAGPAEEDGGEAFAFRYSPGKLRGNQYKKMMTKEELEEEQRVQKEQLAAIFKLMKDNEATFGEMSAGDVQEQLRLYDM
ncbi:matrix-remodeling-associated protein 7 isoform X2 [Sus scrofa]|uniref:Matrix remodeling associated 7 n=2 Tax=Sus scrofa TaxID=9823 RepID=A0A8D0S891_PIG|nr:matrix-remodeling-associated protein 7 isoform X2 [Sus scrofa]